MDILRKLIGDSSVWLESLVYDLSEHKLLINLVDNPTSLNFSRQIVVSDIISFDETIDEFDNDLTDSIIGIHWLEDAVSLCIKTEAREIIVKTSTEPYATKKT